jgi:hypothetical protein
VKSCRFRLLTPTTLRAGLQGQVRLALVVYLHEGGQAYLDREGDVAGERGCVEEGGYEEDGVGAGAGLEDLGLVHGEVLADDGERGACSGGVEVFEGALERSGSVRTERQLAPSRS